MIRFAFPTDGKGGSIRDAGASPLQALLADSADVILLADRRGDVFFASDSVRHIERCSSGDLVGRPLFHRVDPDHHERLRGLFEACAGQPGGRFVTEYRQRHRDGTWRDLEATLVNRLEQSGVEAIVVTYRDITARKQAQADLAESEAEYRSTFDEAPVGIGHTSLDGRCLRVNERLRSMLGYSADQLHATGFALTHPDDVEQSAKARRRLLAGEIGRYSGEKRYRRADGTYFWAHVTVSLHRNAAGEPKYFIAVVEDVSERRQAQDELQHVFNLSPDMICTATFDGQFTRINEAWTRTLGRSAEELRTTSFLDFIHPDDREASLKELRRVTAGQTTAGFTNRCRTADGSYRWMEWNATADPVAGVIYAVARDQTDRRLLEEQLHHAQKMEAVGRLAGGVAHDFNNLLTAIIGFGELTLDQLAPDAPARQDVGEILGAARRAAALTSQLLAFSRKQILEPTILDLNTVVDDMQALIGRVIGDDVVLSTTLGDGLCRISADRSQIEQVLMNLAVNARDAMASGGTLRIETDAVRLDRTFVAAHPSAAEGPHVRLRVSDTGTGMEPEVLAHIFEPFFTTKPSGKGTGLGLATVYGIVKQSGGYIWVDSRPDHGTSFTIALPCAGDGPRAG